MPLSERGVLSLRIVNDPAGVDLLCFKWPVGAGSRWNLAIPLRTCSAGIILALPGQTISAETLIGPHQLVTVSPQGGTDASELLEVQMVEFAMEVHKQLEKKTPRTRRIIMGFTGDVAVLPNLEELNTMVESWLEGGDLRLEEYFTAAEEIPPQEPRAPAPNADILEHLQALKTSLDKRFGGLEAAVQKLEAEQKASQRPQPKGPNEGLKPAGGVEDILQEARTQIRRPPRRMPDEPGRGAETAVDLDLLAPRGSEDSPSVDETMKMALVQLLHDKTGKSKRKSKKLPGLAAWEESESSGDETSGWSSSSKGGRGIEAVERLWGAMRNNPEPYQERMEQRMMKAVEATELTPNVPMLFAKSAPVGKSRTAGYCLQGFAHVHRLLLENKPKQARLQVLRMMASLEQFLIDESWTVAGRLTGMEEPPWGHWATQDSNALRKQYVYTRLAESSIDQRAEGRRVAGQEAGCTRQAERQRRGQGCQRKGDQRVRAQRFLRYTVNRVKPTISEDRFLQPLDWIAETCDSFKVLDLPLAKYFRSTFSFKEGSSQAPERSNDLFPCPPPYPWVVEKPHYLGRSRRQRKRWRVRRAVELWVNLMVCALSQEALGVEVAPLRGRRGVSLSMGQNRMCSFLRSLALSVVRLGSETSGCGLRLPATAGRLDQLREQLKNLEEISYAKPGRKFDGAKKEGTFTATQALPVVAERLSLPDRVKNFDPSPFLSPTFRHLYENPGDFLKPESEQPAPIRVRGTASRQELLKVFERWDRLDRLYICRQEDVSPLDRCEVFAVAKDSDRDRQILHRKRRNLRERHTVGASKDLPHGVLLCQLPLEDRYVCVCSVDDIRDFYHAYSASEARAKSSPVGPVFRASEVGHLKAFREAVESGRLQKGDRVACCFRGLGMGDHAAVDIAQESHVNLFRTYGGLVEGEILRYRNPLPDPPSKFYEGVMIDDHLGLQLLERKGSLRTTLAQEGRDQQVFANAERAYLAANLESHPKKRQRRQLHTKVWGVELECLKGLVGPVRSRLLALAALSARAALPGPVDRQVLDGLCGLWSCCAQFRRPLFSFMFDIYHQQGPERAEEPFLLTRKARQEFILLACLTPICLSDLRALPDDYMYCVDPKEKRFSFGCWGL